ncbi:hypothetical protein [Radiobacillus sp. PE A8.2]|uniref:hypothetical protein n=1 Tax=Radiobacillus sp. PE A8.2 TaxID=3380349 RepID=UPI00388F9EE7
MAVGKELTLVADVVGGGLGNHRSNYLFQIRFHSYVKLLVYRLLSPQIGVGYGHSFLQTD